MRLVDFIKCLGDRVIRQPNEYFIPGHNGPYNDPETLVRNKGHWLITLGWLSQNISHDKYLDAVVSLADDLSDNDARPYDFSFHHRSQIGKDKCNGLIGQAWTFEALAHATLVTQNPKYVELAEEVFFHHFFNYDSGLWCRLEIDGTVLSIDSTFNHQLWFAACASLLKTPRLNEIHERIICFLDTLNKNLTVLENGLIYHPIENQFNGDQSDLSRKSNLKGVTKSLLNFLRIRFKNNHDVMKQKREKMIYKSVGYHQFNMYAFAMLKETLPDHLFWKSSELRASVDYLISDQFNIDLSENIYGFPYNPPGFEVPYVFSVFTDIHEDKLVEICSWWVNEQFKRCYNQKTGMMDRNTNDPLTHTARIYELTRLPISILERIEIDMQTIDN